MSIQLKDIKREIKFERQDMEAQNETNDNEHSVRNDINTSASIKKEYENDGCSKFSPKDYDFVTFETIYVKEEKIANHNIKEDNCLENNKKDLIDHPIIYCKSEMGMEKHSSVEVKDEPMSDTETPQDGSTSQVISDTEIHKTIENTGENSSQNKFTCEICNDKFIQKLALDVHMLIHTDERSYECEICKKKFKKKSNFDVHMRIHTGERPYECEICKKSFSTKAQLHVHGRIHSGEKPYECEICKKTFTHRGTLITHKRTHFGEKPYECEMCTSKFRIKGHLNRHMRIHSGEETYECKICKDKFTRKRYLVDHMRIHTEKKPYEGE